ncbi:MAG: FTR1 family protein, partial [Elainellaceae cyanobacterium]
MTDLTAALPTFVITLREGVEAALVVGIVMAYLQKANQSRLHGWVYGGIGAGVAGSLGIGALLLSL